MKKLILLGLLTLFLSGCASLYNQPQSTIPTKEELEAYYQAGINPYEHHHSQSSQAWQDATQSMQDYSKQLQKERDLRMQLMIESSKKTQPIGYIKNGYVYEY